MVNTNLFELSSTFEAASGGGTLNYPNTSLIKDTNSLSIQKEYVVEMITFSISGPSDSKFRNIVCEKGMTFEQFANSEYNTIDMQIGNDGSVSIKSVQPSFDLDVSPQEIIQNGKSYSGAPA